MGQASLGRRSFAGPGPQSLPRTPPDAGLHLRFGRDGLDGHRPGRGRGLFDLSGYFAAKRVGCLSHFEDPKRVDEFLNMLRGRLTQSATEKLLNNFKPPFPYSGSRFSEAVEENTVWARRPSPPPTP